MDNPCKLNGFAFIEFSAPDKNRLTQQFLAMGFQETRTHQTLNISSFQQGRIEFIVNAERNCQAAQHAQMHGPGACAMGFLVEDANHAFNQVIAKGAQPFKDDDHVDHQLPAIKAIGGSVIYFVDANRIPFANQWHEPLSRSQQGHGLIAIDHLTHNVHRGHMDQWADFYARLFNFREIRYFDIEGQFTGLVSRAMASPCGKIKIPLNESKDDASQIEEFLKDFNGEGIQHIALSTDNIYQTVAEMMNDGIQFLDVPDVYYDFVNHRIPWSQEPIAQLKAEKILIDGEKDPQQGLLLQIFTENTFGPVFFEIIQRKGNEGFGEGNFQALFEAIERDQIARGTLKGRDPS